ncbi:MAG: addiction module protein [Bacteroidota bacterium]|nr:addiction module protein [Bacteroidota bacterium]
MKQIAVTIPDNKESLFIELLKSISFVKGIETIEDFEIPEEHKQIVRQRIKACETDPSRILKWDEVKNKIKC